MLTALAPAVRRLLLLLLLTRLACSMGGLHEGLAVELANNSMAVVVEATPEYVKLDANNMMSGKTLLFELEVLSINRQE